MQRAVDLSTEAVATALAAKTLAQVANDAATTAVAVLVQCSGEDTALRATQTDSNATLDTITDACSDPTHDHTNSNGAKTATKGLLSDDGQVGCVPSIVPRAPKPTHLSAEGSRLAAASGTPPMTTHKGKSGKKKGGKSGGAESAAVVGSGEKSAEKGETEQKEAARVALLPQEVSDALLSMECVYKHALETLTVVRECIFPHHSHILALPPHPFSSQGYLGMHVVRNLVERLDDLPDELATDPGELPVANMYRIGLVASFK